MKKESEIKDFLMTANAKRFEKDLGIQIRNGQSVQGIKAALKWVLQK